MMSNGSCSVFYKFSSVGKVGMGIGVGLLVDRVVFFALINLILTLSVANKKGAIIATNIEYYK